MYFQKCTLNGCAITIAYKHYPVKRVNVVIPVKVHEGVRKIYVNVFKHHHPIVTTSQPPYAHCGDKFVLE